MVEVGRHEDVGLARLLPPEYPVLPLVVHPVGVVDDVAVGEGQDQWALIAADVHRDGAHFGSPGIALVYNVCDRSAAYHWARRPGISDRSQS